VIEFTALGLLNARALAILWLAEFENFQRTKREWLNVLSVSGSVGVVRRLGLTPQVGAKNFERSVLTKIYVHQGPGTEVHQGDPSSANVQPMWWGNWHNWHPGWGWRNWHPGWGNGGWGNGGWGNGGWHNWHNWHNWANW
jgi:hypothetical protein